MLPGPRPTIEISSGNRRNPETGSPEAMPETAQGCCSEFAREADARAVLQCGKRTPFLVLEILRSWLQDVRIPREETQLREKLHHSDRRLSNRSTWIQAASGVCTGSDSLVAPWLSCWVAIFHRCKQGGMIDHVVSPGRRTITLRPLRFRRLCVFPTRSRPTPG